MHKRPLIVKSSDPNYCKGRIRKLIKDYIGGDVSNPELSPLISNDPILQQQCRTRGYMTIPIAGELRNVICGNTDHNEGELQEETLVCPLCHKGYCKRHLAEHLDEPIYTTPRGREIRVENPEIYIGKPDADLRTEMSSWDNQELNRAFHKVDSLVKSMQEGGAGSGHYGHAGVSGERGGSAPSGRTVIVYHGTTEESAKSITNEGLTADGGTIFTTDDYYDAKSYGQSKVYTSSNKVFGVVKLSIPQEQIGEEGSDSLFISSYDSINERTWYTTTQNIPSEYIIGIDYYKVDVSGHSILIGTYSKSEETSDTLAYVPIIIGE